MRKKRKALLKGKQRHQTRSIVETGERAGPVEANSSSLLNANAAAAMLNISTGTLYHWLSERRGIPVVRLSGRCVRFRRSDLEAWIEGKVVRADVA